MTYIARTHQTTCRSLTATFIFLAVLAASPILAATHTVCASGCSYSSIQSAVSAAAAGDIVELAPETFMEGNITIAKSLTIRTSAGRATINAGSSRYVFRVSRHKTVSFEDLTLRGGTDCRLANSGLAYLSTVYVEGHGTFSRLGGVINQGPGSMTIGDASVVSGNISSQYGGGITNAGDLVIDNSTITGNTGHAGGVLNLGGTVSVTASSFSFNHATFKGGAWGDPEPTGQVAFHSSASTSGNTADVDCDTSWDFNGSPACVN